MRVGEAGERLEKPSRRMVGGSGADAAVVVARKDCLRVGYRSRQVMSLAFPQDCSCGRLAWRDQPSAFHTVRDRLKF